VLELYVFVEFSVRDKFSLGPFILSFEFWELYDMTVREKCIIYLCGMADFV